MRLFHTIPIRERVNFTKSLAVMLHSGISINDALTDIAEQDTSSAMSAVILRVRDDIENGTLLSEAFKKEITVFGTIFVSLIRAGEESGTLQGNLHFLAEWLSRSSDLAREVATATMYPKIVFCAASLLGGSLAVFILPKLVPLFNGLGVELPWTTSLLLGIALFIQTYWLICIAALSISILALYYLLRIHVIRTYAHQSFLAIPFIGNLLRDYQLALITQLFATLLRSGLSINESIDIVAEAATNIAYQDSLLEIKSRVIKGTTLSASMTSIDHLYPKLCISIIAIGEKSGTLVESFEYVADFYAREVNSATKKLPTIIEPLLLVFIALIVGFIALAIVMPIYELTGNISQ